MSTSVFIQYNHKAGIVPVSRMLKDSGHNHTEHKIQFQNTEYIFKCS